MTLEIAINRFGGPEVLEARDVPPQAPAKGQVRIRQKAVGVNFTDVHGRRGDYALVRNPWMPSALTEGLFMMLPEQEAMLGSPEGQLRYARGIARGIEDFLRSMAQ